MTARFKSTWTPAQIETLRTLWAEGHSTAEIGRRMGITKNAVVGRAHRLRLESRPSPINCIGNGPSPRKPRCAPLVTLAPVAAAIIPSGGGRDAPLTAHVAPSAPATGSGQPISRAGRGECQFIPGLPRGENTVFCGQPVASLATPYCAEHHAVCYVRKTAKPTAADGFYPSRHWPW